MASSDEDPEDAGRTHHGATRSLRHVRLTIRAVRVAAVSAVVSLVVAAAGPVAWHAVFGSPLDVSQQLDQIAADAARHGEQPYFAGWYDLRGDGSPVWVSEYTFHSTTPSLHYRQGVDLRAYEKQAGDLRPIYRFRSDTSRSPQVRPLVISRAVSLDGSNRTALIGYAAQAVPHVVMLVRTPIALYWNENRRQFELRALIPRRPRLPRRFTPPSFGMPATLRLTIFGHDRQPPLVGYTADTWVIAPLSQDARAYGNLANVLYAAFSHDAQGDSKLVDVEPWRLGFRKGSLVSVQCNLSNDTLSTFTTVQLRYDASLSGVLDRIRSHTSAEPCYGA